jgi:seryl-tRNA synthetase
MAATGKGDTLMAKKDRLKEVSVKIGTAMGKADKQARKFKEAGPVAKEELQAISKQIDAMKKQLHRTTRRLKDALR